MPIRVLHIIGSMRLGGAQVCVKHIVEGNSNPSIEHFLYPLRPANAVIDVDCKRFTYNYPNYDLRKIKAILSICKTEKIDIIHAHLNKPVILALLLKSFTNTKIVVHDHGEVTYKSLASSVYRQCLRLFKNRIDAAITVSYKMESEFKKRIGLTHSRNHMVYNALNKKIFDPSKYSKEKTKAELGLDNIATIIGFAGRLNNVKGVDIAIKTLKLLHEQNKKFKLVIVGDGPDRKKLNYLIEKLGIEDNSVIFTGFRSDVANIINIFDYILIPSRREPFGIIAIESMAMNIPIITSGIGGLSELVRHNETGIVIKSNKAIEYADWIEKLEAQPALRNDICNNAAKLSSKFNRKEYAEKIQAIYSDIIN